MRRTLLVIALCGLIAVCACTFKTIPPKTLLHSDMYLVSGSAGLTHATGNATEIIHAINAGYDPDKYCPELDIPNPYDESLFPWDFASPTFTWSDQYLRSDLWLITIGVENNPKRIYVLTDVDMWTPHRDVWEKIKANSLGRKATVTISGVDTEASYTTVSRASITLSTSPDGRHVISTVKEQSFFAMLSNLDFSQFFFPVRGLIACCQKYRITCPVKRSFMLRSDTHATI